MFDIIHHTQPGSIRAVMSMWRSPKSSLTLQSKVDIQGGFKHTSHPYNMTYTSMPSLEESHFCCPLAHSPFLNTAHWQKSRGSNSGHWTPNSSALESQKPSWPPVLWHMQANREGRWWGQAFTSEQVQSQSVTQKLMLAPQPYWQRHVVTRSDVSKTRTGISTPRLPTSCGWEAAC